MKSNEQSRTDMASSYTIKTFREVVNVLAQKYRPLHEGEEGAVDIDFVPDYNLKLPPWICQPYYRLPPEQHKQKLEESQRDAESGKSKKKYFDKEGNPVSHKRLKKLKRLEKRAKIKIERHEELCTVLNCDNTRGLKCDFTQCRICCRQKCFNESLNCPGHKIFIKDKRERIKKREMLELAKLTSQENVDGKATCQQDDEETSTPFENCLERMRTNDDDKEHVMEAE